MSPSLPRCGQLFGSKLRVVDENVRARRELPQRLIELRVTRFVVSGVDDRSRRRIEAKAKTPLRVVQPTRLYARPRHFKLISSADFCKFPARRHGADVDREIGMRHLGLENALQTVAPEILRTETIKMKTILFRVQRRKK